jgi:hypothetical protein
MQSEPVVRRKLIVFIRPAGSPHYSFGWHRMLASAVNDRLSEAASRGDRS